MNKMKRTFNAYMYFQSDLIKLHLEKMALKGYKLTKTGKLFWLYEETAPTTIYYNIFYYNEVPNLKDWDFVDSYYDMHIFSSESEIQQDDTIESDGELEFKLINKIMQSKSIPVYGILFFLMLIQFCYHLNFSLSSPLEALGNNSPTFALSFLLFTITTSIPLFSYTLWYDKSKENIKIKNKHLSNTRDFNKLTHCMTIAGIITITISYLNTSNTGNTSLPITKTITYYNDMYRDVDLYQDKIPLTMQELGFDDNEYYSYFNSYNVESLFVKYNQSHQSKLHAETEKELEDLLHLDYNIIEVKFTPCFNSILNSLIYTNQPNQEYILTDYHNVDEFYQMFVDDIATSQYVFAKGNKIVFLEFYAYMPSDYLLDLTIQKLLEK